ncbi:MAG TPA: MFS transporter [Caulobacteraceae bacterium]|nr:MFS transporter [Caulobacteraceae bacterium]
MDTAETIEGVEAQLAPETSLEAQEADYERFVEDNLPRNFAGHFVHGMLGMTGFRIFNSPTFLPAYLHIITAAMPGSDFLVGLGQSVQQLGSVISPVIGAAQIEHRKRVLPVSMLMGTLMRVQIAAIALCAWFLQGPVLVFAVMFFLMLLGLFQGAQGVAFQLLLAKVIPIRLRGRLQALRNLAGGQVSAGMAYLAGRYLIGGKFLGNGYAATFALSAILTTIGLSLLAILMREPEPPTVRPKARTWDRMREFPALLAADRGYMFFMIAQTCATAGRIGVPFYILFARHIMPLTGAEGGKNIGLLSLVLFEGDSLSNMLWGTIGDRLGFRASFVGSMALWIASTVVLLVAQNPAMMLVAFGGLGAAQSGFQMSSQTMVLEFGARQDMPMRLGLSQTAQGFMNTIGPLIGGLIAITVGYRPLFIVSIVFEAIALGLLLWVVDEPRYRHRPA